MPSTNMSRSEMSVAIARLKKLGKVLADKDLQGAYGCYAKDVHCTTETLSDNCQ